MAKRKSKRNKKQDNIIAIPSTTRIPTLEESINIVQSVEEVKVVQEVQEVQEVTTTKAPIPVNTDRAKSFLQNVQEKQIEQIHDWLDSIEESMLLTKNILNNTTNNKEESFALKRIQKLYHQLNLIKNIKKGKTVIMGFNKKKLHN